MTYNNTMNYTNETLLYVQTKLTKEEKKGLVET